MTLLVIFQLEQLGKNAILIIEGANNYTPYRIDIGHIIEVCQLLRVHSLFHIFFGLYFNK